MKLKKLKAKPDSEFIEKHGDRMPSNGRMFQGYDDDSTGTHYEHDETDNIWYVLDDGEGGAK